MKKNCNCEQCIRDIAEHDKRIKILEQKKKNKVGGGGRPPRIRISDVYDLVVKQSEILVRLDQRVGRLETNVSTLNDRVGKIETQVSTLNDRVGKIEIQVSTLNTQVSTLNDRVGKIETQVSSLNKAVFKK